ncbi:hypothetical protein MYX77_00435 [Acidobacteriia bacterium AH_259_A11_L15]|nr:hypothetical protein [Acidobacteriia bacterium AH_259_A11_L15]
MLQPAGYFFLALYWMLAATLAVPAAPAPDREAVTRETLEPLQALIRFHTVNGGPSFSIASWQSSRARPECYPA